MMTLLDAHIHLCDPGMSRGLDAFLAHSRQAGICFFVCNSTNPSDWQRTDDLSKSYSGIIPCFGLHPWFAQKAPQDWVQRLSKQLDGTPSCLGEIGLDKTKGDFTLQKQAFEIQWKMSLQRRIPAMIHCVNSWEPLIEVLQQNGPAPQGFLLHAYSGSSELIPQLAKLGAYFSFAGFNLQETRKKSIQALKSVPLDRLLLETDFPSQEEDPADLPRVLSRAGEILQEPASALARRLWNNAQNLFHNLLKP